ncbi:MAG: Crp/Fnr family transcriptional regulator [Bacteroidota bacterium]
MTPNDAIQSISQQVFPLPPECVQALEKCARLQTLPKKTTLVREGEHATRLMYIVEGSARAYYLKHGKDVTDWFAFEHEFIVPLQSYFLDRPNPHYIETIEPTTLLSIDRKHEQQLSEQFREFDRLGKLAITRTMLQLQERIVSLQFETAQHKYESLLKTRPDIELRVPLNHIASYLGITLETLSRIRRKVSRI